MCLSYAHWGLWGSLKSSNEQLGLRESTESSGLLPLLHESTAWNEVNPEGAACCGAYCEFRAKMASSKMSMLRLAKQLDDAGEMLV